MRNVVLALGLSITLAVSGSTSSCKRDEKICDPYAVRKDSYQPERWWLCNKDGTKETPQYEPSWPPDKGAPV